MYIVAPIYVAPYKGLQGTVANGEVKKKPHFSQGHQNGRVSCLPVPTTILSPHEGAV